MHDIIDNRFLNQEEHILNQKWTFCHTSPVYYRSAPLELLVDGIITK